MKTVILYIAQSLDGYVASSDGGVAWLDAFSNPGVDYGFEGFSDSIDTVVQGNSTFKQFPVVHSAKNNYVFSHVPSEQHVDGVTFVSGSTRAFVYGLDDHTHQRIWLLGGPTLLAAFLNEGQVDEMFIFVMPILLGEGIPLFRSLHTEPVLSLIGLAEYANGVVCLHYKIES